MYEKTKLCFVINLLEADRAEEKSVVQCITRFLLVALEPKKRQQQLYLKTSNISKVSSHISHFSLHNKSSSHKVKIVLNDTTLPLLVNGQTQPANISPYNQYHCNNNPQIYVVSFKLGSIYCGT